MTNLTTATMSATIAPELKDLPHVPIDSLEPFQGDLKELSKREYAKLKKSLLDNGIIVPFFVWKETGKILDGHQRERVFINEGWLMDVPVIYISADSEQDAKKKLLVISSQYGRMTQDGFDSFTFDLDDEWIKETLQFDALPFVFDFEEMGEVAEGDSSQSTGEMLSLVEITIDDPKSIVNKGDTITLGDHVLLCCEVMEDWEIWSKHLTPGCLFVPYPGPFVVLSKRAQQVRMVMVQPDVYIAGHIVDKYMETQSDD